jgi:hypothetical protein
MGDAHEPLNVADPKAFMAIVLNPDPEQRAYGLKTFDDVMICETLRYGVVDDPHQLPALTDLYDKLFMQAEPERRMEIYQRLRAIVTQLGGPSAGSVAPYMLLDTDIGIVSSATSDYASFGTLIDNDPMTRPREIVGMIRQGTPRNSAAVVGGLLVLGDPRVCELVRPLCDTIDDGEVATVSKCWSGFTAKCVVEFYLDWLDRLIDSGEDSSRRFGHISAGLKRLAMSRGFGDGLRPFPYEEDSPDFFDLDPDDFAASIAERLYAVERRETPPRLTSSIIEMFGLAPGMPPEDMPATSWSRRAHSWLSRRMPWR